jgi:hypothetical protein
MSPVCRASRVRSAGRDAAGIELAAARVEALGVTGCWTGSVTGSRCWPGRTGRRQGGSDRWRPRFPGPFTLEGAEAVAAADAGLAVLPLVDCSLLVPPRPGPDGRPRYVLLETLRAYGGLPRHRRAGLPFQPEMRIRAAGPVGEQRHRLGPGRHRQVLQIRQAQRRQPVPRPSRHAQRLPAGRQHPHVIGRGQQPGA